MTWSDVYVAGAFVLGLCAGGFGTVLVTRIVFHRVRALEQEDTRPGWGKDPPERDRGPDPPV